MHHLILVAIFCIINELCRLAGVEIQEEDERQPAMSSINNTLMRKMSIRSVQGHEQEVAQAKMKERNHDESYRSEMSQPTEENAKRQ